MVVAQNKLVVFTAFSYLPSFIDGAKKFQLHKGRLAVPKLIGKCCLYVTIRYSYLIYGDQYVISIDFRCISIKYSVK